MNLDRLIKLAEEKSFLMPKGLTREQRREWAKENIMTANEFVKKFEWGAAKEVYKNVPIHKESSWKYFIYYGTEIDMLNESDFRIIEGNPPVVLIQDIVRLVESYELVESYGGLENAKKELQRQSILRWINPETERLREAIADVESCQ